MREKVGKREVVEREREIRKKVGEKRESKKSLSVCPSLSLSSTE